MKVNAWKVGEGGKGVRMTLSRRCAGGIDVHAGAWVTRRCWRWARDMYIKGTLTLD